jgi:hypothetical protein
VAKPRKRKSAAGRPPIADLEALEGVRGIRAAHPRWGYFRAALAYVHGLNPPQPPKHESVARRLADKLKVADGRGVRREAMERELLWHVRGRLLLALYALDLILRPGPKE